MKSPIGSLIRIFIPALVLVAMLVVVGIQLVYAQTDTPPPPGIDQLVQSIMAAGGTYLVAYLINLARVKWGLMPGSIFVTILVPVIGLAISYLTSLLGSPGNSWIVSFLATLGATWLSQVQAQLNTRTGPSQYVIGASQ